MSTRKNQVSSVNTNYFVIGNKKLCFMTKNFFEVNFLQNKFNQMFILASEKNWHTKLTAMGISQKTLIFECSVQYKPHQNT